MNKVIFIAHGGSDLGMGHIIRSMSLANEFRIQNYEVKFISKYETGKKALLEGQYEVLSIAGKEGGNKEFYYGSLEEMKEDLQAIEKILAEEQPGIVVIDSYQVTDEFFRTIARYTTCSVYIDDIAAFPYPVDIVINGNISAGTLKYEAAFQKQKFLLGLEYNLIRQEFNNIPRREVTKKCHSVMVSTGAADPHHMTEKILDMLMQDNDLKQYVFHVVIGKAFPKDSEESIKTIAAQNSNIVLYENPPKMSEIMQKVDFAVTAGGSTIYELFACGVISFAFIYADNQRSLVELSAEKGLLFHIGTHKKINEKELVDKIKSLGENTGLRKSMVQKMQGVIDCKGTKRIVEEIEKFRES